MNASANIFSYWHSIASKTVVAIILVLACVFSQFAMLSIVRKSIEKNEETGEVVAKAHHYKTLLLYVVFWLFSIPIAFLLLFGLWYGLMKACKREIPKIGTFLLEKMDFCTTQLKKDGLWIYILGIYLVLLFVAGAYLIETQSTVRDIGSVLEIQKKQTASDDEDIEEEEEADDTIEKAPTNDRMGFGYRFVQVIGLINLTFSGTMMFFLV